ncbi:MAG: transposase [Brevefilum sp.]
MRNNPLIIDLPPEKLAKLLETVKASAVALLPVGADHFTIHAGELSKKGFDQMRQALHKYWPVTSHHDLNRYVGLYLDERFYYLIAKFLPQNDTLLSLLFHPQTPLVRIRQDMTNMMRSVLRYIPAQGPADLELERSLQFVLKPYPAPDPQGPILKQPAGGGVAFNDRNQGYKEETVPEKNIPIPPDQTPEWRPVSEPGKSQSPSTSQSMADPSSGEAWVLLNEIISGGETSPPKGTALEVDRSRHIKSSSQANITEDSTPHLPDEWQSLEEAPQPEPDLVRLFHEDLDLHKIQSSQEVVNPPLEDSHEVCAEPENDFSDEDTQPLTPEEVEEFDQIKLSDITFYLVPRMDRHYILGELAHRLRGWFPVICETYGWQLDFLSVRPDYIKWRLHDFPDALIHEMLEIIRQRTSKCIFRIFPNMKDGNPTEDFWSPGYLVDRQNQDFSTQVLIAHVKPERNSGHRG